MLSGKEFAALRQANVKLGLDIVLCLRPYSPLERVLEGRSVIHPVRTLAELRITNFLGEAPSIHYDDPVREALDTWLKESRNNYVKIVARLEAIAMNETIANRNILKRVQHKQAKGIYEVVGKGDHARVFVFYDPPSGRSVLAAGTYWKLGRSQVKERQKQDEAILRAATRREDGWPPSHFPNCPIGEYSGTGESNPMRPKSSTENVWEAIERRMTAEGSNEAPAEEDADLWKDPDFVFESLRTSLAEDLYRAMEEAGLNENTLARRMGITRQAVNEVFQISTNMTLKSLARFCVALGVRPRLGIHGMEGRPSGGAAATPSAPRQGRKPSRRPKTVGKVKTAASSTRKSDARAVKR